MNLNPPSVVVSGLPRSGTSLMMQVLQAGGLPLLTDARRVSDQHNPKGYWELERVKFIAADNSWLSEAKGKGIKIVAPLIPFLPLNLHYQIVFMKRDVSEIIDSQNRMLSKQLSSATPGGSGLDNSFRLIFDEAVKFGHRLPEASVHICEHRDLLERPLEAVGLVKDFLKLEAANPAAMAGVVNPELYRARNSPS